MKTFVPSLITRPYNFIFCQIRYHGLPNNDYQNNNNKQNVKSVSITSNSNDDIIVTMIMCN